MSKKFVAAFGAAALASTMLFATPASAQATRTWVSGVGDDANPCSRTAPCKTFAGAISKTAAGGEINCLDPAGYGAVTITKALVISCPYTEGGALAAGNGIVVNAGVNDVVVIRGLDIFGVNPPTNGVRFIAGGELHIEDCVIRRFNAANSQGVSFQPSGASLLYIVNTTITSNGSGSTGGGILVQPTGTGSARVSLRDVRVHGNANNGIRIDSTGNTSGLVLVSMENSEVTGNGSGISVVSPAGGAVQTRLLMQGSNVSNNPGTGITANGAQVQLRVGNSTISFNGTGLSSLNGAQIFSYGDNRLGMNIIADGSFVTPSIPKS